MKTKLYSSIFLWLAFVILIVSYSFKNEEEELKAISATKNVVLNAHKEYYDKKLNDVEILINDKGNDYRDIKVQDTVKMGRVIIDSLFQKNELDYDKIKVFLYEYNFDYQLHDYEQKFEDNSEIIKNINNLDSYQYYYTLLYAHHNKLGGGGGGFDRISIMKSSDTTIAFNLTGEVTNTIQFINQKDNKENNWKLSYDKNSTEPIIFQINTYTKTDTIRKKYQIKPQKGKKLKPFDYEEIEIK